MATNLLHLVECHDYQRLFLEHLRWSRPDMQALTAVLDEGRTFTATNVSSYKGLRVWVCSQLPNSSDQAAIDRAIAQKSTDRIVIFHHGDKQVWRWPARIVKGGSTTTRLTSHVHITGKDNPKLIDRLNLITLAATEDLSATEVIDRVRQAFDVETEKESKRASKLMASMYDALAKARAPEHDISVTLARILFLMFGDDTDMWEPDLFQNFIINHTKSDGSDLSDRINELFEHLDTSPEDRKNVPKYLSGFKYVNGGIFKEPITLPAVGSEMRTTILDASTTNWSDISPAIFGSMFQSVRNAETRRIFGEHYTSEKDILRTLNPLFLDELRQEFIEASSAKENARKRLRGLRSQLAQIQFLDPACGCGNFIIIAYRELRLLEIAIVEKLRELGGGKPVFVEGQMSIVIPGVQMELGQDNYDTIDDPTPLVTLDNFYGIEIDEWPAKIAETAMFLTDQQCDLQMQKRLGFAPERLPISRQATIVTATKDDPQHGNSLRLDWASLFQADEYTVVAGNPPYAGQYLRSDEQTADLQLVWGDDYDGYFDYVTGWHAKAIQFLAHAPQARFAYVTTNSITQGQPVPALFEPIFREGWRIRFAHRTFPWESEASGKAAVHCIIVGFDKGGPSPQLWEYDGTGEERRHVTVPIINAYLVDAPNVLVKKRSKPIGTSLPEVDYGSKPTDGGGLVVKREQYSTVMADPIAAAYVRPFVGADELIKGKDRWCLWLVNASSADLNDSAVLAERMDVVRDMRLKSTKEPTRKQAETPHLFAEIRQPKAPFLCIPSHFTENRDYATVQRFDPTTIASNAVFTASDDDGFLFSIISSSLFMVWQRLVGGRIKSDYRFSNTVVWNNFPLGEATSDDRGKIIAAGQEVLRARQVFQGSSLETLYDPAVMPEELVEAHKLLDAVLERYLGVPDDATELDRQRLLLERYASQVNKLKGRKRADVLISDTDPMFSPG